MVAHEQDDAPRHLKRVSRIKHQILTGYLPAWARILGSRNKLLCYFDCYAGPGAYESEGHAVPGSPTIAVSSAIEFSRKHKEHRLVVRLIEADSAQLDRLRQALRPFQPYPNNLDVKIRPGDALSEITGVLDKVASLPPAFFMVDPYGHPLPLPVMNRILSQPKSELLINLMWWRVSMDIANPSMQQRIDQLFGDRDWRNQLFVQSHGQQREREFIAYFKARLEARYVLEFRIRMDPEDRTGGSRTKYYLLHASNNVRAVLLMKEVMWPLGDEEGTFDYAAESQQVLISSTPRVEELQQILTKRFAGQEVGFDELRERTWELPFIEKHYRELLRQLESSGRATIRRITSKKTGITGNDLVRFAPEAGL